MLRHYFCLYPHADYGGNFCRWAQGEGRASYNSYGNGAAMRVSPVGWCFDDLDTVLAEAEKTALPTHSHPEGVKGAQAVAAAIFLARREKDRGRLRHYLETRFGYDLSRSLDSIRPDYRFDVTCQGSVPEALIAFFEAEDFEDAVRGAVSLGGDSDTQACIAGSVAEAYFGGVPQGIQEEVWARLDDRLARVVSRFREAVDLN
ncbi:ADP-ribosylglycohydrolase family protein [Desulfuromonas sp.]|uniref:ADP-ribosylglycohydrolase family protein n=1 Tax=Desulfuromonas sp. TaxID=892 RepID=UPI0025BB457B|nr:ADP-ribosylglycohydrolase family protein [Desulfuromonas sp.]